MTGELTSHALAQRFGGGQKTTWANYRNGSKDIPLDLLRTAIKELQPVGDRGRLFKRAKELVQAARNAREGRGVALEPEPNSAYPAAVHALTQVIWVAEQSAFVRDTSNALRTGELRREDLSYEEPFPKDFPKRLAERGTLIGHFVTDENGTRFSQRYGQANPWPQRLLDYKPGRIVGATVVANALGGLHLQLESGGISYIEHGDGSADLTVGSQLQVSITGVHPREQRISVVRASPPRPPLPWEAYPRMGEQLWATMAAINTEKGYALVRLDDYPDLQAGLLHRSDMTEHLERRLQLGEVSVAEKVLVEPATMRRSPRNPAHLEFRVREVPAELAFRLEVD
ncbi:hypothetical protein OG978_45120 (plasmid) [Streptomyces sp. NBC_01591]|uniref:hypothetical protein n=1 Tax=Streptomyces sp. NBC_01591 TaxID=2975888 RepID=UPI002DDC3B6D|nr:hypothetical protein [Streptomyces sp. NBC_01591]WSD74271.1 hypothetical protein OG978_45120 [Streptomyces sp. NBC_01591]